MAAIHLPTIMLGSFAALLVFSVFFILDWLRARHRLELLMWSLSFFTAAIGFALLSQRTRDYNFFTISLGNSLALAGLAFVWVGLRLFDGRRLHIAAAFAGPVFWTVLTAGVPEIGSSVNIRLCVYSVLVATYSILIAREVLRDKVGETLPSRVVVAIWFFLHGSIYLLRIPFSFLWPVVAGGDTRVLQPFWYGIITFELFVHIIVGGFSFFVLMKERMEWEHRKAAETDALTGLANRRAFFSKLDRLTSEDLGRGALLYMDIDHFKRINDQHGHSAGDMVLSAFGALLSSCETVAGCVVARLGGEEFAAFLPDTEEGDAMAFGNRLREVLAREGFKVDEGEISVSVSIGVASGCALSSDELLKRADIALYRSKLGGRDRVTLWTPEAMPLPV
ncbi:diguanylate cyclase [Rhizobium sp. PDO1-076]|uniref:GGDEF domain-containing protein n=1 Tax=Rhizobium sp. PDO1-076 TaxID=1125979 RepID=UPI00024E3A7B|nr:GGDEF domain-containing protein [Rhizobium sp. PDO1-076]EHS53900.1 diguanylate cyclase [Rhizobium sp. PDO1-076]